MFSDLIVPKRNSKAPLVIDGVTIIPNQVNILKINAGKLPSDDRINVYAHVYHTDVVGPSVLILAGVHGNEVNGIEIVRRSIEQKFYDNLLCGTVIVIPLLNVFGFINFKRDVVDGKDLNRSFPGHTNGSLASRVARIITKKMLPFVDVAIDFHTGGDARYNYPQVRYAKQDKVASLLSKVFGAKYTIEHPLIANSFRKVCFDMKIPAIVYEGGESIRLDQLSIDAGLKGIQQILSSFGLKESKNDTNVNPITIVKDTWIRASAAGIFIWSKSSGQFIHKGDVLGEIKSPFGNKSIQVVSPHTGHIIGHNNGSVVSLGEALFHIGFDTAQQNTFAEKMTF